MQHCCPVAACQRESKEGGRAALRRRREGGRRLAGTVGSASLPFPLSLSRSATASLLSSHLGAPRCARGEPWSAGRAGRAVGKQWRRCSGRLPDRASALFIWRRRCRTMPAKGHGEAVYARPAPPPPPLVLWCRSSLATSLFVSQLQAGHGPVLPCCEAATSPAGAARRLALHRRHRRQPRASAMQRGRQQHRQQRKRVGVCLRCGRRSRKGLHRRSLCAGCHASCC